MKAPHTLCRFFGCPHRAAHGGGKTPLLCSLHFDRWRAFTPDAIRVNAQRRQTALADFIRLAHAEANALTPEERARCVQPLGPVAQTFTPEEEQPPRRLNHCVASGLSVTLCGDPPTFNEDNRINCPKCLRQLAQKA